MELSCFDVAKFLLHDCRKVMHGSAQRRTKETTAERSAVANFASRTKTAPRSRSEVVLTMQCYGLNKVRSVDR